MASSHNSSLGLDWRDVAGNIVAFEAINGVRLEIRMTTGDYKGRADLILEVHAHQIPVDIAVVPALASSKVSISAIRLKSLEGALIHLLYLLDGQLASQGLGREEPEKA